MNLRKNHLAGWFFSFTEQEITTLLGGSQEDPASILLIHHHQDRFTQ